jgi:hypothetical protein
MRTPWSLASRISFGDQRPAIYSSTQRPVTTFAVSGGPDFTREVVKDVSLRRRPPGREAL